MTSRAAASVIVSRAGAVTTIIINRPEHRNAVDLATAAALKQAFSEFDADSAQRVAVLAGQAGHFCAGADLKAIGRRDGSGLRLSDVGPMGPTAMELSKPVIAAVEGFCVAGGLELALWADLRVAARNATFGVFCRRFGVPLVDGGTVRLPRLIGHSRAMDMILTGRSVGAEEALSFGLANRLVEPGEALAAAQALAEELARHPQQTMRDDRQNALAQWSGGTCLENMHREQRAALAAADAGSELIDGASQFAGGAGRRGSKL